MKGCLESRGIGKDGVPRWRLVVTLGRDSEGKLIQEKKKFAGQKNEADTALAAFLTEVKGVGYVRPRALTVEAFLKQWLKDYAKDRVAGTTYQRYEQLIEKNVIPHIGTLKVQEIQAINFEKLYKKLQKDGGRADSKEGGLSGTTCLQIHRILKMAFGNKGAIKWGILAKNPLDLVDAPKKENPDIRVLDEEQATTMVEKAQAEESWFYMLVLLAVTSGLRRGELLGLRWKDVDFNNNVINVNKSLQYVKKEGKSLKDPKTKNSRRSVYMPSDVMDELQTYKDNQAVVNIKDDLVFANWRGQSMCPDHVSHKFSEFMNDIGFPGVHLHSLRHSCASLLRVKGEDVKAISEKLGHSTVQFTQDIYTEVFTSAKKQASEKMAGMVPCKKAAGDK